MVDTRADWRLLIAETSFALPPLHIEVESVDASVGKRRADLVITARWSGGRRRFAAEYLPVGTPRNLARAIEQARAVAAEGRALLPMVVAPFLTTEALNTLERAGVSGIDLSGNGMVTVPGKWLVWRTGQKNRYPASASIRDIYRGTSSLVPRVFLSRPEYPRVGAIQEEIRARGGSISIPTVSKVLKTLQEDLIVERTAAGGVRLIAAERLLDRLVGGFTFTPVHRIRGTFTDPDDRPASLRQRAERAGARLLVRDERDYVAAPLGDDVVTYYTSSIRQTLAASSFGEEPRYGEAQLIETRQAEVFFDAREEDGMLYASPLQIYLELANGGKREQEVAEPLRADLLAFRFG
ncbi:MAG TPA: hypothetical protein VF705_06730 [Longimicrobium sp.]